MHIKLDFVMNYFRTFVMHDFENGLSFSLRESKLISTVV